MSANEIDRAKMEKNHERFYKKCLGRGISGLDFQLSPK